MGEKMKVRAAELNAAKTFVKLIGDTVVVNPKLTRMTVEKDDGTSPPAADKADGTYTNPTAGVRAGFKAGSSNTWDDLMKRIARLPSKKFNAILEFDSNNKVKDLNFEDAQSVAAEDSLEALREDMHAIRELLEGILADGEFEVVIRSQRNGRGRDGHRRSDIQDLTSERAAADAE